MMSGAHDERVKSAQRMIDDGHQRSSEACDSTISTKYALHPILDNERLKSAQSLIDDGHQP